MDITRLGQSGLQVSRICLGCLTFGDPEWAPWVMNAAAARPFIERALDLGVNFFDTADWYSHGASEQVVGQALRDLAPREEIVVATKVYFPMSDDPNDRGLSRKHIHAAIDASLERLGLEYVDLYQIHRWDAQTPIEETMRALHEVVQSGKARYIGASSMYAWQFAKAQHVARVHGWTTFISMQNHYNLAYREEEREMIPQCLDMGVGVIPWSPLARGFLTRRPADGPRADTVRGQNDNLLHQRYTRESDRAVANRVCDIAAEKGVSPAQVALAWLLARPGVSAPIVGVSKLTHLEQAVEAVDIDLTADEIKRLEEPYQPHPVIGHD